MAMVLIVNGCANNDGEIEYLYLDEAPTVRISTEALEVLADSSEPYTLTYTARTSWAGRTIFPAVHAGVPQTVSKYSEFTIEGITLYIHNDLLERRVEIYSNGSLNAKDY